MEIVLLILRRQLVLALGYPGNDKDTRSKNVIGVSGSEALGYFHMKAIQMYITEML